MERDFGVGMKTNEIRGECQSKMARYEKREQKNQIKESRMKIKEKGIQEMEEEVMEKE